MATTQFAKGTRRAPSTGTARGSITQAQRQALNRQQLQTLQNLGQQLAIANDAVPTLENLTLGLPALNINAELTPADVSGRYLGLGTYQNIVDNPHVFNTKTPTPMTPEWARYFNSLRDELQESLAAAAANPNVLNYSTGLEGVHRNAPGQQPVIDGAYTDVDAYYPDSRARFFVSTVQGTPAVLLPGSTQQRAAMEAGLSVGQVNVKSPGVTNKKGYVKVGSKGWRDAIARWYNETLIADDESINHLIGQGAVYGLGEVFAKHGINVGVNLDNGNASYYVSSPGGIEAVATNDAFFRDVAAFYDAYLKDPDKQRLGEYGAASFAARHQGNVVTGPNGETGSDFINMVEEGLQKGNVKGLWKYNNQYKTNTSRRYLTAFPMRNENGQALSQGQYFDQYGGRCNVAGPGVGTAQRATSGGEYGYRNFKGRKDYISRASGMQGQRIEGTTPIYRCVGTPSYVQNPRRQIYQKGQARGTVNYGLPEAINEAQRAIANAGADYEQFQNLTVENLQGQYDAWTNPANFGKYGSNPYFMLNPTLPNMKGRRGFSRAAPSLYAANLDPRQQQIFNNLNLTQVNKNTQANELLAAIQGGRTASSQLEKILGVSQANYKGTPLTQAELNALKSRYASGTRPKQQ